MKAGSSTVIILSIVLCVSSIQHVHANVHGIHEQGISARNIMTVAESQETKDIAAHIQDDYVRQTLVDVVNTHVVKSIKPSIELSGMRQSCVSCTQQKTHEVVALAATAISNYCATTTSPTMKSVCKIASKSPDTLIGYLIYQIQPINKAVSHCVGSGVCDQEEATMVVKKADRILTNQAQSHEILASVVYSNSQSISKLIETAGEFADIMQPLIINKQARFEINEPLTQQTIQHCTCMPTTEECCKKQQCMSKVTEAVMKISLAQLADRCVHTKQEVTQMQCDYAQSHPELTYGFVLAKVQPSQFALGYCYGSGAVSQENESVFQRIKHSIVDRLPFSKSLTQSIQA